MESKRKASNGGGHVEDAADRSSKRRRSDHESTYNHAATPAQMLQFVDQLKATADKSGRLVATDFLTLPDRRELPDYYEKIQLPIALDTIEGKVNRGEFSNLSELERWVRQMVTNAKAYNMKGSQIHEDAERIRKATSNYMSKYNPDHKQPNFAVAALDISTETLRPNAGGRGAQPSPSKRSSRTGKSVAQVPSGRQAPASKTARAGFAGLTFQQAQEKIVSDLLELKEHPDDTFSAFEVFEEVPDKSLKEYYKVIPDPTSLNKIQKRVRGLPSSGKGSGTGISDFKNWSDFEQETSLIWKNAMHYNEDGSEIFELARDLEAAFKKLVQEAKQTVAAPSGMKIKLRVSGSEPEPQRKITLKLGRSPADSPAPHTNGSGSNTVSVANGEARKTPLTGSKPQHAAASAVDQLEQVRSLSSSVAPPSPTVLSAPPPKSEVLFQNSPAVPNTSAAPANYANHRPAPLAAMLPPSTPGLSNHNQHAQNGYAQSFNHPAGYSAPSHSSGYESKWRPPGKTAADALITNLKLTTHHGLNLSRHFRMDVPPSETLAHQSITINLPATHYYLQIKPTVAASLMERQHKLFVTCGNNRLNAMPVPGQGVDPRHPLFEARLLPGVIKIDIEIIAALPKGAPKLSNGQDAEMERITIFANLMRS